MKKRLELVYGKSGSGKTTWGRRIAEHIYTTTGKKTRWYAGDGGVETLAGTEDFIDICNYTAYPNSFETCARITDGWFPIAPGGALAPTPDDALAEIGMNVFEGLNLMGDYLMGLNEGGLANLMARGITLNNDASFKFTDGTTKVGGNSRSHYGLGQTYMIANVQRSAALPGFTLWTAHERETKQGLIGPDVVGEMLTTTIGAYFGNTIHLMSVPVKQEVIDQTTRKKVEQRLLEYRAYTREHFDPSGAHFMRYFANTRLPRTVDPELMPEYLLGADPIDFYVRLEEARKREMAAIAARTSSTTGVIL